MSDLLAGHRIGAGPTVRDIGCFRQTENLRCASGTEQSLKKEYGFKRPAQAVPPEFTSVDGQ